MLHEIVVVQLVDDYSFPVRPWSLWDARRPGLESPWGTGKILAVFQISVRQAQGGLQSQCSQQRAPRRI